MRSEIAAALLAFAVTYCAAEGTADLFETTPGSHLVDLTPENYNATLLGAENVLVEFYAPWCGKCKTIKREYERAADIAAAKGLPLVVARIDAQLYKDWAVEEMGVTNLPTFFLYTGHGSDADEFPFLTTGEAIVAGVDKVLGLGNDLAPYKNLDDWDALELAEWLFWRGTEDGKLLTTLILYSPSTTNEEAHGPRDNAQIAAATTAFDRATKQLLRFSNLRFGLVTKPDIFAEYELPTNKATIVLYTEHDEGRHEWTVPQAAIDAVSSGSAAADSAPPAVQESVGALIEWVMRRDVPLVTDVHHRTLQAMRRRVPMLAIAYFKEQQLDHAPTLARIVEGLQAVAGELEARGLVRRGEFTLAYTNGDKYGSWMTHFGLQAGVIPAVSVEWTGAKAIFDAPQAASASNSILADADEDEAAAATKGSASASSVAALADLFKPGQPLSFAAAPFHVEASLNVPARDSEISQVDGTAYKRAAFLPVPTGEEPVEAAAASATVGADGSVETSASTSAGGEGEEAVAAVNPTAPKVGPDGLIEGPEWVDVPVAAVVAALEDVLRGRVKPTATASE